jgi:hypothetical protein
MKLQKKWTARRVIEEEWKADILQQIHKEYEEETGQKPGQQEVFKRYQPTMTAIMNGLDDNELEEAWAKPNEWTVISHTFALLIQSSGCQIRSDPIHRSVPDPL